MTTSSALQNPVQQPATGFHTGATESTGSREFFGLCPCLCGNVRNGAKCGNAPCRTRTYNPLIKSREIKSREIPYVHISEATGVTIRYVGSGFHVSGCFYVRNPQENAGFPH